MGKTNNQNTNKKGGDEWEKLLSIKHAIFDLNQENIVQSANSIISKFDELYPESFNQIVSQMIYVSFLNRIKDADIYLYLLKEIDTFEEKNKCKSKIFKVFKKVYFENFPQESFYLQAKMINRKFLEYDSVDDEDPYFVHYMSDKEIENIKKYLMSQEIFDNFEELSKNNWELHKKLIEEGHNPNEIAKIIRNDEIEKLQEISSQNDFDYNQAIKQSLYERCSFVNKDNNLFFDEESVSLIDYAAFFSAVKCFKYLLMNDADVTNTGKYAVAGGNEEIIHLCEQNHSTFKDAYEAAIEFHRNKIFKYMYENKIGEINDLEELGIVCVTFHNYEIFTFLHEKGMDINEEIIKESARIGNIFLVKHFLSFLELPKDILVISSDNIEMVKYFLEQEGIDINAKDDNGETALLKASYRGHTEIVQLLLEQKGIDVNAKNDSEETALICASQLGYKEIIKLLLKHEGIDINAKNEDRETALMEASHNGYTEIVQLLLEQKGIDVNVEDIRGYTALMEATNDGKEEVVKLLLKHKGIDINVKNIRGETALMWASRNKTEIFKLLLEQEGIDINAKDNDGVTALMSASIHNHIEMVKLLLNQKGIDINAKNNEGWTALICATVNNNIETVKLLLEQKGIDVNVKDNEGKTALDYVDQNQKEIVELIGKKLLTNSKD